MPARRRVLIDGRRLEGLVRRDEDAGHEGEVDEEAPEHRGEGALVAERATGFRRPGRGAARAVLRSARVGEGEVARTAAEEARQQREQRDVERRVEEHGAGEGAQQRGGRRAAPRRRAAPPRPEPRSDAKRGRAAGVQRLELVAVGLRAEQHAGAEEQEVRAEGRAAERHPESTGARRHRSNRLRSMRGLLVSATRKRRASGARLPHSG